MPWKQDAVGDAKVEEGLEKEPVAVSQVRLCLCLTGKIVRLLWGSKSFCANFGGVVVLFSFGGRGGRGSKSLGVG